MDYNKYSNSLANTYHMLPQDNGSILNDIIQHPFIDTLHMDINSSTILNCLNNILFFLFLIY